MVDALVHGTSWGIGWCMVVELVHGRFLGTGWCMVDALVYGTSWLQVEVQVGAWLMHLFMVHVYYRLIGTCLH